MNGLYSTVNKAEETYTLTDFIKFKTVDNMTYYNLSILAKSVTDEGIIYSKDNVIYTYLDILRAKSVKIVLTDDEYQKYRFRPKLLAYDIYGHTELFFVIMAVIGICDIKDFDMKKFNALRAGDLNALLNQIYSAEVKYIDYNRKMIGEKNYII